MGSISRILVPKTKDQIYQSIVDLPDNEKRAFLAKHIDDEVMVDVILKSAKDPKQFSDSIFLVNDYSILEKFVQNNIDLNYVNSLGENLLTSLAKKQGGGIDFRELFTLILNGNVDVNFQNNQGETALFNAVQLGKKRIVELLLEHNADPNIGKLSPLIQSCISGYLEISKLLIDYGADVNYEYDDTMFPLTPLTASIANNRIENVKLLIEKGANINIVDKEENNLLLQSIKFGNLKIAKLFLELGLDPHAKNKFGTCAMDYGFEFEF